MAMNSYKITWEIDIDALTPEAAALKAREYQVDPYSSATCFVVADQKTEETTEVDTWEVTE